MKSNKITLVKFTKRVDIDNTQNEFEHPLYNEVSNILNEDDTKFIGFTNDEDMFLRLADFKVNSILSIFSKYGFEFTTQDYTKEVYNGVAQKNYPEVEKLTPDIFRDFRIETTSIDDVLDKIIESGMDSLDDTDLYILKK